MKKVISLFLVLVMCLCLCACGKSEAVKNVEALIAAIGEVTVDSEADVVAAEEAYNALLEEEKASVENYDTLATAKESLELALWEQFRASLVGDWVGLADGKNTILSLEEDGTTTIAGLNFTWELTEDKKTVRLNGAIVLNLDVSSFFEYTTLYNAEIADTLVRENDTEEITEKYLTVVELTAENVDEYIGEPVYLVNAKDEWGETMEESPIYHLPSKAFDSGLVYLGSSADFAIDLGDCASDLFTDAGPFMPFSTWPGSNPSVDRVKGSVTFIASEYIAEQKYSEDGNSRIIILTDGSTIIDKCYHYTYIRGETYYKIAADANIEF